MGTCSSHASPSVHDGGGGGDGAVCPSLRGHHSSDVPPNIRFPLGAAMARPFPSLSQLKQPELCAATPEQQEMMCREQLDVNSPRFLNVAQTSPTNSNSHAMQHHTQHFIFDTNSQHADTTAVPIKVTFPSPSPSPSPAVPRAHPASSSLKRGSSLHGLTPTDSPRSSCTTASISDKNNNKQKDKWSDEEILKTFDVFVGDKGSVVLSFKSRRPPSLATANVNVAPNAAAQQASSPSPFLPSPLAELVHTPQGLLTRREMADMLLCRDADTSSPPASAPTLTHSRSAPYNDAPVADYCAAIVAGPNSKGVDVCDRLRCASCNRSVRSYDDVRWEVRGSVDLATASERKLLKMTVPASGVRVFACGCHRAQTIELVSASELHKTWSCRGGHALRPQHIHDDILQPHLHAAVEAPTQPNTPSRSYVRPTTIRAKSAKKQTLAVNVPSHHEQQQTATQHPFAS